MNNFLYIDPGTGSMLFSIVIGIAATVFFLFRALLIKIKFFFSGSSKEMSVSENPIVIYNEGKQYLKLFHPILAEAEKRGVSILYLTSFAEDPELTTEYKNIKCEYIGEGNKAFTKLNFLKADVLLMTTPGLNVYQLKKSKTVKHYAHILHAASDATGYRLFGIDYYDSVLLTGDYQKKDIRYLEKTRGLKEKELVAVGCPYLDEALKAKANYKGSEEFTVLVSPSWGANGLLSKFGEKLLDPLEKSGWHIIVRPHPQSKKSEPEMLERLTERYKNSKNIEWDYDKDNMIAMSKSNVMISDFSGIIFDYSFLFDNPLLYVETEFDKRPYDMDDVEDEAWQFETLKKIGIKIDENNLDNIKEVIQNATSNESLKAARAKAKEEAWFNIGSSAQKVVDFLVSKITKGE